MERRMLDIKRRRDIQKMKIRKSIRKMQWSLFLRFMKQPYELQKLVDRQSLYSRTLKKIPTPKFVAFYNGMDEPPERFVQCLSDAFEKPVAAPDQEFKVLVLNINYGHNADIMDGCKALRDYSIYVRKVRDYAEEMPLNQAVEKAVNECIKEDVLQEFLRKY